MQTLERYYRVGGHAFRITFADERFDDTLLPSYSNFSLAESPSDKKIFHAKIDSIHIDEKGSREIGQFNCGGCNHVVYRTEEEGYIFHIYDIHDVLCCKMITSHDFTECHISMYGITKSQLQYGLNNAVMMCYAFSCADKATVLMHASVIRCEGMGYLMTAPSGTGKSTHTRLWYDNIPGCDLMNDDNPVVRIVDGKPIVYGSPWSGKTPCYRNIQAPIGGIVRIQQRPCNTIAKLSTLGAFGNLLTAVGNMKWDLRIHNGVCDCISELIRACGVYELGCLPNAEAAHLCHDTFISHKR